MRRLTLPLLLALIPALPALSQPLPPGLAEARLLPGWVDAAGNRVAALELVLEPGWKTYWRSPGDSGLPPEFDWSGSRNLAGVSFHWPAPQPVVSGGEVSLGFRDRLVLPFTAHAEDPQHPVTVKAAVELGLCERICVPAHLELEADAPDPQPDPVIEAALAAAPRKSADRPGCHFGRIGDGMRVTLRLDDRPAEAAAIELDRPEGLWVSTVAMDRQAGELVLTADLVPPEGKPFEADPRRLVLTLVGPDGAVEMTGCAEGQGTEG